MPQTNVQIMVDLKNETKPAFTKFPGVAAMSSSVRYLSRILYTLITDDSEKLELENGYKEIIDELDALIKTIEPELFTNS